MASSSPSGPKIDVKAIANDSGVAVEGDQNPRR